MAERSVFVTKDEYPFFEEIRVQFDYFRGFALSQRRKNEIGLHQNFLAAYPEQKVLEVCSSSLYSLGAALSSMNLKKRTKWGVTYVESAFQSSRIYGDNDEFGPFPDLLLLPGRECKKAVLERGCGLPCRHFRFDDLDFYMTEHCLSLFFNFVYLNALCEEENKAVADRLIAEGYTAFTDLATNAINSQARSCAIYVSLVKNGLINEVREYDSYLRLYRTTKYGESTGEEAYDNVQLRNAKGKVSLLSPVVPRSFTKIDVETWYEFICSRLTNRKTADNFLDLMPR